MSPRFFTFSLFVLLILAVSAEKIRAGEDPLVVEARGLSRLGLEHFKKGEYERAYDKFLSAYRKVENLDRKDVQSALTMNLGLSLWKMNRLVEAREYFIKYIEISPHEEKKEIVRSYIKEIDAELSKTHTLVTINTEPEGAEILIHEAFGTRKVQSPFISYLPFGVYTILIKKEGFTEMMEKVVVEKEKPVNITVTLEKAPEKGEAKPLVKKPEEKPAVVKKDEIKITGGAGVVEEKTYYPALYGWIGVGAGAAMIGAGVAMTLSALGYRDKMDSNIKKYENNEITYSQLEEEHNSHKGKLESRATLSYIFYGFGLAATAGGAAYLLFLPHDKSDITVSPIFDRNKFLVSGSVNF